jgi:prepilin-type N-terminal cleavage/methylation domain-containing protein
MEGPRMLLRPNKLRRGFTLLELSIVLVIIGILTGGVVAGQALIQAAMLNKVMTDLRKFVTAVNVFQNKYEALPGDISNATYYWGAAGTPTNTWAGCYSKVGTGTQTCDGNGNGQIFESDGYTEMYRAWQHLALAGLIEGSYNGVNAYPDGTLPNCVAGTNCPKGPLNNTGYDITYLAGVPSAEPFGYWPPLNDGHVILFGGACPANTLCWTAGNPALTPDEMLGLDQKYDDGRPYTGSIKTLAYGGAGLLGLPLCATSPYTLTSTYNVAYHGPACGIVYVTGF